MAELACVYDAAPVPRTPEDIISTPAQKKRKKSAGPGKSTTKGKGKPREPQARGKSAAEALVGGQGSADGEDALTSCLPVR